MKEVQVDKAEIGIPGCWHFVDNNVFVKAQNGNDGFLEANFAGDKIIIAAKRPKFIGGVTQSIETLASLSVKSGDHDSINLAVDALESLIKIEVRDFGKKSYRKFTVFSTSKSTGEFFVDHVWALSPLNAHASAAAIYDDPSVVLFVAITGWIGEGDDVADTDAENAFSDEILAARDYYGDPAWELTHERIQSVLSKYSLNVVQADGKSFSTISKDFLEREKRHCRSIVAAAMKAPSPDLIEQYGFSAIKEALADIGVLAFD